MKRKFFTLFVWLLLPVAVTLAQNQHLIDSIRLRIKQAEGQQRFDLLNDLAWEHRFAQPDSTIYYSTKAFEEGKKLGITKGLARSLNFIGLGHNYKGMRILAFENYNRALQMATGYKDSLQIGHAYNNTGRLFFEQGLLSRSYENYIKAISIFQDIDNSSGLAYVYQSLANLYKTQRDYKKAEENLTKAYNIRLELKNTRDIMSAMVYLARLYQETEQWEKSIRWFQMADSTGNLINDEINLAEIKTYLAESYLNNGATTKAEQISKQGLEVILRKNNVRMLPQAYHIMGKILFAEDDFAGAKNYFAMSLDVSTRIQDLNSQMKAYHDLWKVSERQKNESERLKNLNQYLLLKDSIKDLDLARQVERFQFEIEIQRKEQENELLKVKSSRNEAIIQQQKLQNVILIVIIGFVSILGFLQWRNGKKRRAVNERLLLQNEEIDKQRKEIITQNEKLFKRNHQLSELNHEKDTIMSIVAHDLKSPLHRIKGIVDLMELEGGLTNDQKVYMKMSKDATQAGLDLITGLLDVNMLEEHVEPTYTSFDLSKFLLDKTESFIPAAESKNIHLNITRVSSDIVVTDIDYLNRIMDNLISNAIKFSEKGSTIVIAAGKQGDEVWISVKDQGPGFSTGDRQYLYQKFKKLTAKPTAGESSNGLGLAIVKTLVDRLKGSIELASDPGKGSEFIIRIPIAKETA